MDIGAFFGISAWLLASYLHPKEQSVHNQKDFAADVIAGCYRRAFSMSFDRRFATDSDFNAVRKSINDCHAFLQRQLVFAAAHYPDLKDAVFSLLRHSDAMDSMLTEMQESVMMNPPPADSESLSGRRLDGLGPPQLTRSFRALEAHRVAFLREMQELATRFAIQFARDSAIRDCWKVRGPMG